MKYSFRKWSLRLFFTSGLVLGLLLLIVLHPALTYAHKTTHQNFTVYHNGSLPPALYSGLDSAMQLLHKSEFYHSRLKLDICPNEGLYPALIQRLRGRAFAWGFYDKVVMQGAFSQRGSVATVALNGYHWNLTQLLAHEMIHCLQYNGLGFWHSNPVARIPDWKWEGYAEYIARRGNDPQDLATNLQCFLNTPAQQWEITLADRTIAPRDYYGWSLLVHYCMDVKKLTYREVLADSKEEEAVKAEMMAWYGKASHASKPEREL